MESDEMTNLRRKIDQYLVDWKNSKDKKPLIISGAYLRSVGASAIAASPNTPFLPNIPPNEFCKFSNIIKLFLFY